MTVDNIIHSLFTIDIYEMDTELVSLEMTSLLKVFETTRSIMTDMEIPEMNTYTTT